MNKSTIIHCRLSAYALIFWKQSCSLLFIIPRPASSPFVAANFTNPAPMANVVRDAVDCCYCCPIIYPSVVIQCEKATKPIEYFSREILWRRILYTYVYMSRCRRCYWERRAGPLPIKMSSIKCLLFLFISFSVLHNSPDSQSPFPAPFGLHEKKQSYFALAIWCVLLLLPHALEYFS